MVLGSAAFLALHFFLGYLGGTLLAPLLAAVPLLGAVVTAGAAAAVASGLRAALPRSHIDAADILKARALTVLLHVLQPLARLLGRLSGGLSPWRQRGALARALPRPRTIERWTEKAEPLEARLCALAAALRRAGAEVRCGGGFDRWDLELRGGALGVARLRAVLEEHGDGRQLLRVRLWPRAAWGGLAATIACIALALAAALDGALVAAGVITAITAALIGAAAWESAGTVGTCLAALAGASGTEDDAGAARARLAVPATWPSDAEPQAAAAGARRGA
jgi:hypothetical protein